MAFQETQGNQNSLKKDEVGGLTFLDFKTHYEAIVIKIMWCWLKGGPVD